MLIKQRKVNTHNLYNHVYRIVQTYKYIHTQEAYFTHVNNYHRHPCNIITIIKRLDRVNISLCLVKTKLESGYIRDLVTYRR